MGDTLGLERFLSVAPDLFCIASADTERFELLSPSWERVLGWSLETLRSKPWLSWVHPDDVPSTLREARRLRALGPAAVFENRYLHRDGTYRWLAWCSLYSEEDRKFYGVARDVTQDRENRRKLATLLSNLAGYAYRCRNDENWTTEFISSGCEQLCGWSPEDHTSGRATCASHIHPDDKQRVWDGVQAAIARRARFTITYRICSRSGAVKWVSERGIGIFDSDGRLDAIEGLVTDISGQVLAEDAMRDRAALTEAILRSAPDAVVAVNADGRIVEFNPAAERMFGYARDKVVGLPMRDVLAFDFAAGPDAQRLATTAFRADGTTFPVELSTAAIEGPGSVRVAGFIRDMTHELAAEERLRQAERMEALGRVAGGVAHDFNNLLLAILGFTELALMEIPAGSKAAPQLQQVMKAGERSKKLIHQLLAFSRRQVLQPRVVDPRRLLEEAQPILARLMGEQVTVAVACAPDVGNVMADPTQLHQVILNLATNARDVMPEGGRITLSLTNDTVGSRGLPGDPSARPGVYVVLSVEDTGRGMSDETRHHVFEPFFTTKSGHGTGLGLSTVHGIVTQSGGFMRVESVPGRGSTFQVYLPRVDTPARGSDAQIPAHGAPARKADILLVEDDANVREIARRMLEAAGHRVRTAENGRVALDVCSQKDATIDMLVTDAVMPELGGFDLAARALQMRPGLRVLVISGYAGESPRRDYPFLAKPFTSAELTGKVAEVLATPPPAA